MCTTGLKQRATGKAVERYRTKLLRWRCFGARVAQYFGHLTKGSPGGRGVAGFSVRAYGLAGAEDWRSVLCAASLECGLETDRPLQKQVHCKVNAPGTIGKLFV